MAPSRRWCAGRYSRGGSRSTRCAARAGDLPGFFSGAGSALGAGTALDARKIPLAMGMPSDVAFEIHPGEDLHDGATFERFLAALGDHPRASILFDPSHFVLQQLDYLAFIDLYHERIKCFHVKDAEFRPSGRAGVYGGYLDWLERPGRFRSLGDGQVDFKAIFSKFAQYEFAGWAVLEWECCLKHPEEGAREGAPFIRDHIIRVTERAFDDFAGGATDAARNRRLLGLP
jgi:sugar phosphate isomerase/epimerase